MLSHSLIKDLILMIKDHKFQLFFFIMTVLFILSAISSSTTYKSYAEAYQNLRNEHQNKIHSDTEPSLLNLISESRPINVVDIPTPSILFSVYENFPNQIRNSVMLYFPQALNFGIIGTEKFRLNWFFLLGILMGFIMLILSFETFSSEKRDGTLRLLSSYGLRRQTILWSKYLCYMILYFVIIVPPALISMILFFALTGTWSVSFMVKYFLIIFLSIPFASFFTLLGIFISMAKNYQSAIVTVVFVWLLFVIIIPQSANIFGKQLSSIKTNQEYDQINNAIYMSEWAKWNEERETYITALSYLETRAKASVWINEKLNISHQQMIDDQRKQLRTIQRIKSLSPFIQFERISEIIFDKGSYLLNFKEKTLRTTLSQVRNLMIEQDKKDDNSLHLFYNEAAEDNVKIMLQIPAFSTQKFDHPNLLFVTNIPTDDTLNKTLKIILRLLPILALNLLLIIGSVLKLERLDIR